MFAAISKSVNNILVSSNISGPAKRLHQRRPVRLYVLVMSVNKTPEM